MELELASKILLEELKKLELEHRSGYCKLFFYLPTKNLRDKGLNSRVIAFVEPKKQRICFNKLWVLALPENLLINTLRHEYAHSIDLVHNGEFAKRQSHGISWQVIAASLGAKPRQGLFGEKDRDFKYVIIKLKYIFYHFKYRKEIWKKSHQPSSSQNP